MEVHSQNDKIFIGKKAGIEIIRDIEHAKKMIKVISPYLTPSYVEKLLESQNKGIEVTLITSDDVEIDKSGKYSTLNHKDLIKQQRDVNSNINQIRNILRIGSLIALVFGIIGSIIAHSSKFNILPFAIISLIGIGGYIISRFIRIYTYKYSSIFHQLKVCVSRHSRQISFAQKNRLKTEYPDSSFVHAKVYVIDDIAYVGSANYTHSGLNSNYETVTKITDKNAVNLISKEVDRLFLDNSIASIDIQNWGKSIYSEPRN